MSDRLSPLRFDKPVRLQCYDPGGTTGFVELLFDFTSPCRVLRYGEFHTWKKLEELIKKDDDTRLIVVYETFHLLTLQANSIPLEVIGVLKYLCEREGVHKGPQTPDTRLFANRRYPNEVRQVQSHKGSALRHGIVYAYKHLGINVFPTFKF